MNEIKGSSVVAINSYFSKHGVGEVNVLDVLSYINSGRKKYDIVDLTNYLVVSIADMFSLDKINSKKLEKYLVLLTQIGDARLQIISKDKNAGEESDFDELIISKFETIPELMQEYYKKNGEELDKELYNQIINIGKKLGVSFEMSSQNTDNKSKKILELQSKIENLEKENGRLNQQLSDALKEIRSINNANKKSVNKADSTIKEHLLRIEELEQQIKTLNEQLESLNDTDEKKDDLISSLNDLLSQKSEEIKELQHQISLLNSSVTELQSIVNTTQSEYHNIQTSEPYIIGKKTIEESALDSSVLSLLCNGVYLSADEIYMKLKDNFNITLRDIYSSLRRIQTRVNIENSKFLSVPKKYGVCKPNLNTDMTVVLPTSEEIKKLLFLSDFHLNPEEPLNQFINRMDSIQTYANKNNIDTIVNLGDFFDTQGGSLGFCTDYMSVSKAIDNLLNICDKKSVFDLSISHLILGGNHDSSLAIYGIDPLKIIEEHIPSVTSVGYSDAILKIGNASSKNLLGIHHEGIPRQNKFSNPNSFVKNVVDFIKNYYYIDDISKRETSFDLFGHIHSSIIDPINGYAVIPSLTRDRLNDGALEIDCYLNSNGEIDYLVVYTLNIGSNKEFKKTTEIPIIR